VQYWYAQRVIESIQHFVDRTIAPCDHESFYFPADASRSLPSVTRPGSEKDIHPVAAVFQQTHKTCDTLGALRAAGYRVADYEDFHTNFHAPVFGHNEP